LSGGAAVIIWYFCLRARGTLTESPESVKIRGAVEHQMVSLPVAYLLRLKISVMPETYIDYNEKLIAREWGTSGGSRC